MGLGRDMRIQAPEMAGRVRDGLVAEGCSVVDAGMIGTEMLYFLVGSRELDGGAMVTASHNPKAYTGVKLVREGALALSGDAGIGDVRDTIEAGLPDAPGGGSVEDVEIYGEFHEHALRSIDESAVKPLRVVAGRRQRDGGADGRAADRPARPRSRQDLLGARRRLPRSRAEPAPAREPAVRDRPRPGREGADLGIAWDGDADRCFFIDDRGRVRRRRLPHRAPGGAGPAQGGGRDDPLRRPGEPGRAGHRGPARRQIAGEPGGARVLQGRHARARRRVRRRGFGSLLLPRLLVRRLGHASRPADPRAPVERGPAALGAGRKS